MEVLGFAAMVVCFPLLPRYFQYSRPRQASGEGDMLSVRVGLTGAWFFFLLVHSGRRFTGVDRRAGAEQERVHGAETEEGPPVRDLQDRRQEGGDRRREDRRARGELRRLHGVPAGR